MTLAPKIRIPAFRDAVDTLNWNRRDLSGATRAEWLREDVRARLQRHIDKVQAMLPCVPARFGEDIRHANESIASAEAAIVRWQEARSSAAGNALPVVDHLEADDFAARLEAGTLAITSIGSENAYGVDAQGRQFFAKDVPSARLSAHVTLEAPVNRS